VNPDSRGQCYGGVGANAQGKPLYLIVTELCECTLSEEIKNTASPLQCVTQGAGSSAQGPGSSVKVQGPGLRESCNRVDPGLYCISVALMLIRCRPQSPRVREETKVPPHPGAGLTLDSVPTPRRHRLVLSLGYVKYHSKHVVGTLKGFEVFNATPHLCVTSTGPEQKRRICLGVASAIAYLHSLEPNVMPPPFQTVLHQRLLGWHPSTHLLGLLNSRGPSLPSGTASGHQNGKRALPHPPPV